MTSHLDNYRYEIAWDSGFATAEGDRTWTDVTTDVEASNDVTITYGRVDTQPAADPNTLALTLKNKTGKYTPGNASSPNYPNVKKGKPVRVSYREPGISGNLLSANQASMETSIADWSAGGTVPPTLASSTTHADNGTKALRITWGTGGTTPRAETTIDDRVVAGGLVVGRTYTAQARLWVTSGTPDVFVGISGGASGTATSTKGAFASVNVTFTATARTHLLQVRPSTAPTSGQQIWVDSVMVDEGSSVGTFTTSAPPIFTRFTGYINEWPVIWPDGSDQASSVTIGATSRRARLGQTAPLTSAIRAASLASDPVAYWPMDEDADTVDRAGRQTFRDITNSYTPGFRESQFIGSFYDTTALMPVVRDGTLGPTDEQSLVKIPAYDDAALFGTYSHYVGNGGIFKINTAGEASMEVVARVIKRGSATEDPAVVQMRVLSADMGQFMHFAVDVGAGELNGTLQQANPTTAVVEWAVSASATYTAAGGWTGPSTDTHAQTQTAVDGELHHYALTVGSSGTVGKFYFDGVLVATLNVPAPYVFDRTMTQVAIGPDTLFGDLWAGHAAVYNRALTAAEVLAHAEAATAAFETDVERVQRVAGRIGVPAAEIDVEASIAMPLGPQPEAGRGAMEVIDETAASIGGIVYDKRDGHLAVQARNTRYNRASSFTLSAASQEVEADLTVVMDDRYLVNTVEYTRFGSDATPITVTDDASIDEHGVYSTTLSLITSSDQGAAAAADNLLYRYAQPATRVSQVTVDLVDLSQSQRLLALAADIGTRFTIAGLPAQAPASSMALFLEGYTETINAAGHVMTINTTPGDLYQNVWILDSNDVLDSGITLAY